MCFFFSFFSNANLPPAFQLAPAKFQMTSFTYDEIEAENKSKLAKIKAANEEKTKESKKVLEKIRRRFFNDVLFPRIIVRGVRSTEELSSFRISRHQPINLNIDMKGDNEGDPQFRTADSLFSQSSADVAEIIQGREGGERRRKSRYMFFS